MAGSIPFAPTGSAAGDPRASLSWRGPGAGRPDLPLPPARMPLLHKGLMRKRWRYVGFYGDEVMLCAAVVAIGPFRHTFWSVWDRGAAEGEGRVFEHTRLRPGRPDVTLDGPRLSIETEQVKASLDFGESEPIEVVNPSGRGWGWTRKRAGMPVRGRIKIPGRDFEVEGFGVDDETAGYHERHVAWLWSAGIGTASDGRVLGWNLTEGINDGPPASERAVWVEGSPHEPAPVNFEGLDAVHFQGDGEGPGLSFDFGGAERSRNDNFGLVRSRYIHRFGTFSGFLDGIELARASGVMEEHDVFW